MNRTPQSNVVRIFIVAIAAVLILFVIDVAVGSSELSVKQSLRIMFGAKAHYLDRFVVFKLRIPRALSAILVGAGLSLSGLMLQTLFHNPLAGPYVLGISSGASLGVAVYTLVAASIFTASQYFTLSGQILAALMGATIVFVLILAMSWRVNSTVSLLIIGIMLGSLTSAIVGVLQYFSSPEKVQRFVVWSLGSLDGVDWGKIYVFAPLTIAMIAISVAMIKPMNALLIGENQAKLTGVDVKKTRLGMIIISSILAATVTSLAGPIAFIGMTVPHIARMVSKQVNFYVLLPGVIVIGAGLMLICDIISQLPGKSVTLPINSVTALFGAPLVIILILQNRKIKASY